MKAYAFRGAVHLMTPATAAVFLALRASTRMWERESWQDHYGLTPQDWPDFRAAVREALTAAPLTRDQLAAALADRPRFAHLAPSITDGSDTLLKPLMWQGDVRFGPGTGSAATLQRLDDLPGWTGLPDVDDAGRRAVVGYLRAYGPTTADRLRYWLGEGLGVRRVWIRRWLDELGARVATVEVDGEERLVAIEDADDLSAPATGQPPPAWHLLPGHDQWVMGPGTAETAVVPPGLRRDVSRGAHLLLRDGVVAGSWRLAHHRLEVSVPDDGGPPPRADDLAAPVARVAAVLGRTLEPVVTAG